MDRLLKILSKPRTWLWISIAVFFAVSIPNLTNYTTADEHFWLPNLGEERVLDYWRELLKGDWEDTQINDKPGVTLAYLSGIAMPFISHLYDAQKTEINDKAVQYDPEITKTMHFAYRLPIVLFIGFFSLYFFWILKRITRSERIAALSVMLILLSPVLLGISHIVNPDTAFWVFGLATMLTFIAYAQERSRKLAGLTALFFGLSLASKYVSVIFIPFFLLILGVSYLYFFKNFRNREDFSRTVLRDLANYFLILIGGTALFSLMMPAAIVDPEVLWESTIGFPGMLPVFLAALAAAAAIGADAFFLRSRILSAILGAVEPRKHLLEYLVYGALLAFSLFVLFNWISKNSIIDLSDIPYYAKTKDSFTEDNPYLVRYVMEFVPVVFALTPATLFLLFFFWMRAFWGETKQRFLAFVLSVFFLVFFAAVVEQGLLVTVRYAIILFPLALILASIGAVEFLERKRFSRLTPHIAAAGIALVILSLLGFWLTGFHDEASRGTQIVIKNVLGMYTLPVFALIGISAFLAGWGIVWGVKKITTFKKRNAERRTPTTDSARKESRLFLLLATTLLLYSGASLQSAHPHFFLYMSSLLPERYVLNHAWGYGGYEAAQYLNALPDAENLTLWANAHGVCEFFVGKCIRSQRLDIREHRVDYLFYAHRGPLASKFETESEEVWRYYPDGRGDNYVKLLKNDPDAAIRELEIKERLKNMR